MGDSNLVFRLAGPTDAAAIAALTRAAYAKWVPLIGREPKPMGVNYAAAVQSHRFDLLMDGDAIAALIETELRGDHLYIVNIAVTPDRQGRGLGRRLLAHAEGLARQEGFETVRLVTHSLMAANRALYHRTGYVLDHAEPIADGAGIHMRKSLASPHLLFLPGMGARPDFWAPMADALPNGWKKHSFGWPGLGDQPAHPAVTSFEDLIALVEARLGETPADLLAQSMGGYVALQVALRNPGRVRRLVLSGTSGGVDVAGLGGVDWRAAYRGRHPDAPAWAFEPAADLTDRIGAIACPTLLIWGGADPISPVAVGKQLVALLPDARLHVVEAGDHDVVATHAAELAPLVAAHLGAR